MRNKHGFFQRKTKNSEENVSQTILCDDCGFSTFNQKQFNAHKLANCKNVTYKGDKYPCDQCNYKAPLHSGTAWVD